MAQPSFVALRVPDYRAYFAWSLLAQTADNVEHVISYWVIFQLFHSPTLAGFAVISHWLPFLLFSVWSGALADRHDGRTLIRVSQAMFMMASAAWGLLFLTGALQMWHAVALLVLHGAAGVVGAPAAQLIVHEMVGPAQLPSAIRLNASSRQLAILLGPAIGGGMMLALGPSGGILANVVLYVPLVVFLGRVPYTGHGPVAGEPRRAPRVGLRDAVALLREIGADRRIVTMIALAGVTSFLVGNAFQAQMPEYAHHLGTDEAGAGYSALLAANAAGAVLATVLLETLDVLRPNVRAAIVCAGAWGAAMALFPAAASYPVALGLLLLAGVFNLAFTSMAQTLVQLLAPPRLRGRVVGLFNTAILGLRAGSGVTVGVLGAAIGVHLSLALSATLVVVVAGVLLVRDVKGAYPWRSARAS